MGKTLLSHKTNDSFKNLMQGNNAMVTSFLTKVLSNRNVQYYNERTVVSINEWILAIRSKTPNIKKINPAATEKVSFWNAVTYNNFKENNWELYVYLCDLCNPCKIQAKIIFCIFLNWLLDILHDFSWNRTMI